VLDANLSGDLTRAASIRSRDGDQLEPLDRLDGWNVRFSRPAVRTSDADDADADADADVITCVSHRTSPRRLPDP
jgi:hypothetical protein